MVLLQPKLHLKVSQRQILTPGLVQMVSVLALNKLELRDMITAEMVEKILEAFPHPEMGYRSCLGIIRLGQRYPATRVEAAAAESAGQVGSRSVTTARRRSTRTPPTR